MDRAKIYFKKLEEKAKVPQYGTEYAAGADLYACMEEPLRIGAGTTEFVHTGLAMEIPEGLVGLVYARSGLACRKGLAPANMVALHNHSQEDIVVDSGERIAQIVITPYIFAEYEETGELGCTERGSGGFGSTGKK